MGAAVCFRPCDQVVGNDCAIAALAMLLDKHYTEVLQAAEKCGYTPLRDGLTSIQMARIAKCFKKRLTNRAIKDLPEDAVGILVVRKGNTYHAVLLFHDVICDPTGALVWEADTFLKVTRYKPARFLEA